jgi:hypothetical protein
MAEASSAETMQIHLILVFILVTTSRDRLHRPPTLSRQASFGRLGRTVWGLVQDDVVI